MDPPLPSPVCAACGEPHGGQEICPAAPRAGQVIAGKYRLERRLGAGGMGEVYEARHTFLGRRAAIKLLLPQYAQQRDMLARFQREARSAGALESEHIAAVTDFGFAEDGAPYLVMEFLEGEDLGRVLARASAPDLLDVPRAIDLAVQACRGLAVAHAQGIIHRDLKPENLFVVSRSDGSDLLKILDFGIAKLQEPPGESPAAPAGAPPTLHGKTRSGTALGTPCYMSPEQARGDRDVDQRTDVYALGVILYQMLAGQKPHDGEGYNAILFHILTQIPEPLGRRRPDLPAGLAEVVACAMAFDRQARYAGAAALAEALGRFLPESSRRSAEARGPAAQAVAPAAVTMRTPDTALRSAAREVRPPAPVTPAATAAAMPELPRPRRRRPLLRWTMVAAIGVAAAAGGVLVRSRRGSGPSAVAPAPVLAPVAQQAGPVPVPAPAPAPTGPPPAATPLGAKVAAARPASSSGNPRTSKETARSPRSTARHPSPGPRDRATAGAEAPPDTPPAAHAAGAKPGSLEFDVGNPYDK